MSDTISRAPKRLMMIPPSSHNSATLSETFFPQKTKICTKSPMSKAAWRKPIRMTRDTLIALNSNAAIKHTLIYHTKAINAIFDRRANPKQ